MAPKLAPHFLFCGSLCLTLSLQSSKGLFSQPFKVEGTSDLAIIGGIIIFHLCDVIFLVRLREKVEIDVLPCAGYTEPCERAADVGFLLDTSLSIKSWNLRAIKKFLRHFVGRFHVSRSGNRAGLVQFNRNASLEFDFTISSRKRVLKKLRGLPKRLRYSSRLDRGLQMAEELFTAKHGDRPDYRNVLFVFTDGKSTSHRSADYEPIQDIIDRLEVRLVC